ncbi:MAG: MFS transporter [Desulfofustis sp.]|nr:MFS transporter [Desulfofustis sp.]
MKSDRKYQTLVLVGAGVFLSTMDSSMVNVALPFIMESFGAPLRSIQWVVLIYLLSITVTLLFWGIVADRFGKFGTYLIGILIFLSASVGCAMAPSLTLLIVLRAIEGLGAAMLMAAGPTIIKDVFPNHQLGRGLGLVGIATSAGLMSGPLVGGLLISAFSWRAMFLACIPVGILMIAGGVWVMRNGQRRRVQHPLRSFDWRGAGLWALLIGSLVLYAHFLPLMHTGGWVAGGGGLALLGFLFYLSETKRESNILPLHLFPKNYYHIGLITASLSFAVLFEVLILMPFYLTHIKGLAASLVGTVMMAVPLTLFVVSPTAGMLYDRFGSRYLTTIGLSICTAALLLLSTIDQDTWLSLIFVSLALLGMGQSMFLAPNTASLLSRIPEVDAGITSGLLATSRNLGMLAGAAFGSMIFAAWFGYFSAGEELSSFRPALSDPFISSLRRTMLCTAALSAINVLISWQRRD